MPKSKSAFMYVMVLFSVAVLFNLIGVKEATAQTQLPVYNIDRMVEENRERIREQEAKDERARLEQERISQSALEAHARSMSSEDAIRNMRALTGCHLYTEACRW